MTTAMSNQSLKALHDRLLEEKPADALHDADSCPLCALGEETADPSEGGDMTKTYSEEELQAAIEQATSELTDRVKSLESSQQDSETAAAVTEAVTPLNDKIAELQAQLDEAVLKEQAARSDHTTLLSWLEETKKAEDEAVALAARREERLAKVKELVNFPEDHLTANSERIAAMSDEDFEVALEGWRALAPTKAGSTVPEQTGLHAAREEGTASPAYSELFNLRRSGRIDLSSL